MKPVLFDAFPLLCWFQEEPGHTIVGNLLNEAEENKIEIFMSIINLGEVYYRTYRVIGQKEAEEILKRYSCFPYKSFLLRTPSFWRRQESKADTRFLMPMPLP